MENKAVFCWTRNLKINESDDFVTEVLSQQMKNMKKRRKEFENDKEDEEEEEDSEWETL